MRCFGAAYSTSSYWAGHYKHDLPPLMSLLHFHSALSLYQVVNIISSSRFTLFIFPALVEVWLDQMMFCCFTLWLPSEWALVAF